MHNKRKSAGAGCANRAKSAPPKRYGTRALRFLSPYFFQLKVISSFGGGGGGGGGNGGAGGGGGGITGFLDFISFTGGGGGRGGN